MNREDVLLVRRDRDFHYPIVFCSGFASLPRVLAESGLPAGKVCLVTDSNVAGLYLDEVKRELERHFSQVCTFVFPAGEASKNLAVVQDLYETMIREGLDRGSILAALGGGVVGDLTGFAAATYLRGIPFFQIPTTLLAQVDSSVGGKTGVDFGSYKNMVGAFHQPSLVYMNPGTLRTLPPEQFSCGMGEVIKTGLICDRELFSYVSSSADRLREGDEQALLHVIRRCCEIKAGIVERDPREKGERALLNLGHTIGHAVEKLKDFSLLHGHCVALGLIGAGEISAGRGLLQKKELEEIRGTLQRFGLPVQTEGLAPEQVLAATKKDKKMKNGRIRFVLMRGLGDSMLADDVTDEELMNGITAVCR